MIKKAIKWEPEYWREHNLPSHGCYGYVNGHLILGHSHHQLIMARLIDAGWTWEQLMEAEQAWGWFTLNNVQNGNFSNLPDELKKSYYVSVRFTSDAGLQNDEAMKATLGAFSSLYHLPSRDDYGGGNIKDVKTKGTEYGSGLHGIENADKYLNSPEKYFKDMGNLFQNIPQPPDQDWDPDWETKVNEINNPDTPIKSEVTPKTNTPAFADKNLIGTYTGSTTEGGKYTVTYDGTNAEWKFENGKNVGPQEITPEFVQANISLGVWTKVNPEQEEFNPGDKVYYTPDIENDKPNPQVYTIQYKSDNIITVSWPGSLEGAEYNAIEFPKLFTKISPNENDSVSNLNGIYESYNGYTKLHWNDGHSEWEYYDGHTVPTDVSADLLKQWLQENSIKKISIWKEAYTPGGKTKGWGDIMEKAQYIRGNGGVKLLVNDPQHVVGIVQSGTDPQNKGPYQTEIWKQSPGSGGQGNDNSISMWDCTCSWDDYAWGRCVAIGSMISLPDGTQVPIEKLLLGDTVIDHSGEVGIVSDIYTEDYDGEIIVLNNTLRVKPTHPILVVPKEDIIQTNITKKHDPNLHHQARLRTFTASKEPRFVLARDIKDGDYLVRPHLKSIIEQNNLDLANFVTEFAEVTENTIARYRDIKNRWGNTMVSRRGKVLPRNIPVGHSLMRIIGYFLAEGCTSNASVKFTFSENETNYHQEVSNLIQELFGLETKVECGPGSLTVSANHTELAHIFREMIGHRIENKKIPNWIMWLPSELQAELIATWFNGDGHIRKTDGRYELTTVSPVLAYQLELLLQRQNQTVHIIHEKRSERTANERDVYKVCWYPEGESSRGRRFIQNTNTLVKCSVARENYIGKLYDLTIIGNPGFLVEGYAVHNTRQWKKYEGRPCVHTLALYWESAANPPQGASGNTPIMQPPTPTPGGGVTVNQGLITPLGQPPMPNVPLTGEPGLPAPLGPTPAPQPAWSEVVQPGKEEGTITFPGTFSHWKESNAAPLDSWNLPAVQPLSGPDRALLTKDINSKSKFYGVDLEWNEDYGPYAFGNEVVIHPLVIPLDYFKALHEIGHVIKARSNQDSEEEAWRWAFSNSILYPNDDIQEWAKKFIDSYHQKESSAPTEPPNYRKQDKSNESCKLCKMMYEGKCWGYGNKPVEPDYVCDSFTPENKKEARELPWARLKSGEIITHPDIHNHIPLMQYLISKGYNLSDIDNFGGGDNDLFDWGEVIQRKDSSPFLQKKLYENNPFIGSWKLATNIEEVGSTRDVRDENDPERPWIYVPEQETLYLGPPGAYHESIMNYFMNQGLPFDKYDCGRGYLTENGYVKKYSEDYPPEDALEQLGIYHKGNSLYTDSSYNKEAAFQNGDIVRTWDVTQGFAQPAYGQPGYPVIIKKNQSGEVLFSDEENTVAIFPLNTGPEEHHLVKVECPTKNLYLDNTGAQPFVKKH